MHLNIYERSRWLFKFLKNFYMNNKLESEYVLNLLLKWLRQDIEFFRYNKLLVALAYLFNSFSYNVEILDQRLHRYRIYHKEVENISHAMTSEGVEFLFIKTITVFPKDIADLDILVATEDDLIVAEMVLKKMGYVKRKKTREQHLWSLHRNGVLIDVELHTSIAAAEYEYYPKDLLFKNAVKLNNGVRIPSPLDNILLNIAHSVMKDLYITLADLLDFYFSINKHEVYLNLLTQLAKDLGLSTPLFLFSHLLGVYDEDSHKRFSYLIEYDFWRKIFMVTNYTKVPTRPSVNTLILSYLEMTLKKLKFKPLSAVLYEILSLPQGKGIDTLLYYVIGAKPLVKKLSE